MLATETLLHGRYRLGPILGRGGGADVYRANDLETGQPVAVKVLRSATPADLHRFEVEARTLARLHHPAIVRLRDDGEHEGAPYLVLDLVDGEPLSTVLLRGPLHEHEVTRIGSDLAGALAHAHALGVVHRDMKPGNVLFDRDGGVHLTDFGIARLTDVTSITATGLVIGTAAYLSPEQLTGEGATAASDIYALGLVLLEALTGERAFPGSASESALARLHRSPDVPPTASRSLGPLLGAMTAFEPSLRPTAATTADALAVSRSSGREVPADATALLPVASDVTTTDPVVLPPARRFDRRRLLVPAIAAAVLLCALLMSAFAGGDVNGPPKADTSTTVTTTPATTHPPVSLASTTTTAKGKGKHHDGGGDGGD